MTNLKNAALARSTAVSAKANTTYGWLLTAFTIARIAGKLVTFRLQTPVAAELRTVRMHIDADARLAAAAGGAARYFADAAGLPNDAVFHLQTAVVFACESTFDDVSEDQSGLDVTLTWLVDRIEVAVSHKGAARQPQSQGGPKALEGVDDVRQEARGGIVVMRLTKFIKQGAASR